MMKLLVWMLESLEGKGTCGKPEGREEKECNGEEQNGKKILGSAEIQRCSHRQMVEFDEGARIQQNQEREGRATQVEV